MMFKIIKQKITIILKMVKYKDKNNNRFLEFLFFIPLNLVNKFLFNN